MQMIDSLIMGGAERVAVNNANSISEAGHASYLCVTRESGPLEDFINEEVQTLNLRKRSTLDIKSIRLLVAYIKEHKIDVIHAHSTSFIIAAVAKIFTSVRVVWHDHNGNRVNLKGKINTAIKYFSYLFDYVIVVNNELHNWACTNLHVKNENVSYIQNYADLRFDDKEVTLAGTKGKRIVVLANLRNPKDHLNILTAFNSLDKELRDSWYMFFVGEDKMDDYSQAVKSFISENNLVQNVHVLGVRSDTAMLLKACDIGVISSYYEGLPMALLEYGIASLAVVSTKVGECPKVLGDGKYGLLAQAQDSSDLATQLKKYMQSPSLRDQLGKAYNAHVNEQYSKGAVIDILLKIYTKIIK